MAVKLGAATLSGRVSPKCRKPGKARLQFSQDNKAFTTIRTVRLPNGATRCSTTFTAPTVLGPVILRTRLGSLSTKGLRLTVTEVVDLQIESFAFSAKTLRVKRWTTVVWTKNEPVNRTVTAMDSLDLEGTPTGLFNSGPIAGGRTFRHPLVTLGMFFYEGTSDRPDPTVHAEVIVQKIGRKRSPGVLPRSDDRGRARLGPDVNS
ncbi:MAG: hypothetical protein NTX16_12290 [Actinobacteria bacterium]|nr:hypothetical protein [Actinomycetota bacterium]